MAHTLDVNALGTAFAGGELFDNGKLVRFNVAHVGLLNLSTDEVAASDPLVSPDAPVFAQKVPIGSHAVALAIAQLAGGDERIAFARVSFSSTPPVRWEAAVIAGQDVRSLKKDEYFGYGVDSGTGCFMGREAGLLLNQRLSDDDNYFNTIIDGMDSTYKHTRSWLYVWPSESRDENVVCFSTGWGDGSYPSFFGFSVANEVVALVTDFFVLAGEEDEKVKEKQADTQSSGAKGTTSQPTRRPWWKFWG
jgi:hypothetical protein